MKTYTERELQVMTIEDLKDARDLAQGFGTSNQDLSQPRSQEKAKLIAEILTLQAAKE